jgi:hypothetical protein
VASSKGQFCRVKSVHGIDSGRFETARTTCVHGCKVVYYRMHARMQATCLIVASAWWHVLRSDTEFGERRILYIVYGKSGYFVSSDFERFREILRDFERF